MKEYEYLLNQSYRVLLLDEFKEYQEAITYLNNALANDPNNSHAFHNRGLAFWEIGGKSAEADFRIAIELDNANLEAYIKLSEFLKIQKRGIEALACFTTATQINPSDARSYRCRGYALAKFGRLREAISDYSRAIELEPLFRETYRDREQLFRALGDGKSAMADLKQWLALK